MRSLLLVFVLLFAGCAHDLKKDIWKVQGKDHGCTGFQVKGGFLITAAHCVKDESIAFVKNDTAIIPELRRLDKKSDVAVFFSPSLNPNEGYNVACWAPNLNAPIFALGYPGRMGGSMAKLNVNLFDYDSEDKSMLRSLDAQIWPGMSGGPLVDEYGYVYGVVHATGVMKMGGNEHLPLIRGVDLYSVGLMSNGFCPHIPLAVEEPEETNLLKILESNK